MVKINYPVFPELPSEKPCVNKHRVGFDILYHFTVGGTICPKICCCLRIGRKMKTNCLLYVEGFHFLLNPFKKKVQFNKWFRNGASDQFQPVLTTPFLLFSQLVCKFVTSFSDTKLESISSTFYERAFCTKVLCTAFL